MRLFGFWFGIVLSVSTLATGNEINKVVLYGDQDYYPYSFTEKGVQRGLYSELLRQLSIPGIELQLVPIPWKRGLKYLEEGLIFGLYPPYKLKQERPYIRPYSLPLFSERVVFYCHNRAGLDQNKPQWPEDFQGLKIGRNLGFTMVPGGFWNAVENKRIELMEFAGTDISLQALALQRSIDCYLNDAVAIQLAYKKLKRQWKGHRLYHKIVPIELVLDVLQQQAYIGYSNPYLQRHPEYLPVIEQLDQAIKQFTQSPDFDSFIDRYWSSISND